MSSRKYCPERLHNTMYYVYDISRYTICKQARHIRYAMKNARLVYSCNILQNIVANVFDVDFGSIASSTCWANKIRQSGLGVWGHFNLHALPSPIHQHPLHFNSGHAICKKMPKIHPLKQSNNKCVNSLKPEIAIVPEPTSSSVFSPHHLHNKVIPVQVPEAQTLQW